MKLLFSEAEADYAHYIFPYAIWAFPEAGETPGDLFNQGCLPSSRNLDRFYVCRQVRVNLAGFKPSSENRRILRKGADLDVNLVPRAQFDYTPERRQFYKTYADIKFGKDVMSFERLDALFASPIISHLLVFTDAHAGAEVGTATLYVEGDELAYYYYAFYDLNYYAEYLSPSPPSTPLTGGQKMSEGGGREGGEGHKIPLGMFMMTSAVARFAELGLRFLYLGTCYSRHALYKTQFTGAQFFNGFRWSDNLDELKYLLRRAAEPQHQHLLESVEYREMFYGGDLGQIAGTSAVRVQTKASASGCRDQNAGV